MLGGAVRPVMEEILSTCVTSEVTRISGNRYHPCHGASTLALSRMVLQARAEAGCLGNGQQGVRGKPPQVSLPWQLAGACGNYLVAMAMCPAHRELDPLLPGPAVQGGQPAEPVGPVGVHSLPLEWVFLVLRICPMTSGFPAGLRGSTHLSLSVHGPEEEGQRPAPYLPYLLRSHVAVPGQWHMTPWTFGGQLDTQVLWCTPASVAVPPGR